MQMMQELVEGWDRGDDRNAAIQEAFTVRPGHLTIRTFIRLAQTSNHSLLQLLLRYKAVQCTSIPCFSELTATVDAAVQDVEGESSIQRCSHLNTDYRLEDLTEVLVAKDFVARLDHATLHQLADTLIEMERITDNASCIGTGSGSSTGPWTEFAPLLAPLDHPDIYLPALLPAFEWIRSHIGGIHMVGCPQLPTPHESMKWESWFERYSELCDGNPAITRFLDPSYILWEEGPGVAPAAVVAALAGVDNQLSIEILNHPNPVAPPAGAGGASIRLLEVAGQPLSVAREIVSAYRSHLSVPGVLGGGGMGPASRFATFSATNLRWW